MKPFIPHELPPDLDWQKLVPLIGKANAAIARYDGLLQSLINPSVLLSPFTTNEAVLSSRIEGTQASLGEVLEHDAGLNTGKSPAINEDIKEIRREMEDINGKIGQIAREMQIFAKKDDVKTLQKYVTMWEPIKFVTENQVEEIIKEMISKK